MKKVKPILTPWLLTLFVLCWALSLHATERPPAEHGSGHSTLVEHGETAHTEHSDTHQAAGTQGTEHGDVHEAAGTQGTKHDISTKQSGENGGHGAATPWIYYLDWTLLGLAFLVTCSYCLWVYKRGKPKHEGLALAFLLVLLVIVMYSVNQLPEVARHFDAASHQFVDGYHEPPGMGSIKFIYKMGLGVCLTIYGIIGREEH